MPEKTYGSALGSWILTNTCQRVPCSERTRSRRSGSTSFRPRTVVSTIGKKQMVKAITIFGTMP